MSETAPGLIDTRVDGGVGHIVMSNPSRMNAMNSAMWRALPTAVARLDGDPEVRVIVVRGAGEAAFSAGADISEFGAVRSTPEAVQAYEDLNSAAIDALLAAQKPVVAAVRGFCLGGGFALAMCCDIRLASADAQFGIPAARLGLGYNPRWMRPLLAGMSAAHVKEVLFTGDRFDSQAALRMGMAQRVYADAEFAQQTDAVIARIAQNAPLSIRASKAAINAVAESALRLDDPAWATLDALVDACFRSADYAEGRAAFAEKRKPVFRGR
ncbi:MAG: enoyl-CoA hydratase [Hyphomicrobiales bacterium]|nr:enoyl-CoA hydratase [Hyphomicrobiales bacterium]